MSGVSLETASRTATGSQGLSHARWVIGSSTDDATALAIAGFVTILLSGAHEAAMNAIDRALASNPSCATALYLAAQVHSIVGHSEKAVAYANRALRQSPFDLLVHEAYLALGNAAITDARYEEAASFYARAVQSNPKTAQTTCFMRSRWLWLDARGSTTPAKRGLELEPQFRLRWFRGIFTREARGQDCRSGPFAGAAGIIFVRRCSPAVAGRLIAAAEVRRSSGRPRLSSQALSCRLTPTTVLRTVPLPRKEGSLTPSASPDPTSTR